MLGAGQAVAARVRSLPRHWSARAAGASGGAARGGRRGTCSRWATSPSAPTWPATTWQVTTPRLRQPRLRPARSVRWGSLQGAGVSGRAVAARAGSGAAARAGCRLRRWNGEGGGAGDRDGGMVTRRQVCATRPATRTGRLVQAWQCGAMACTGRGVTAGRGGQGWSRGGDTRRRGSCCGEATSRRLWSNYGQIMVKLWSNYGQIPRRCAVATCISAAVRRHPPPESHVGLSLRRGGRHQARLRAAP